jgi:hypothetical protein
MPQSKNQRKQKKARARKPVPSYGLTSTRTLFPARFRGPMTYSWYGYVHSPTAGIPSVQTFRLNSVYDPDLTGVGKTVSGYREASALYGRFRVLSAQVEVTFMSANDNPQTCYIWFTPLNAPYTVTLESILAQRFVWSRSVSASTGNGCITHKAGAQMHAIYGVPKRQVMDEDDFSAVVNANPNNGIYMHIGSQGHAKPPGVQVECRITYDVVWSLPKELTSS